MPTKPLSSDLETRIITVLENFLPAEMALVDAERGGQASPPLTVFLRGPRPLVDVSCIVVEVARYSPFEVRSVATDPTGRLGYDAHVLVSVNVLQSDNQDHDRVLDLAERYLAGVVRVLLLKKPGLETVADPIRFSEINESDGDMTLIDQVQSSGAQARTARIPLIIRMREAL